MDAGHLDRQIEQWFAGRWGAVLDFEVEDALAKLVRLGLATRNVEGFAAAPLAEACARLDRRWDEYFAYHDAAGVSAGDSGPAGKGEVETTEDAGGADPGRRDAS